MNVFFRVRAVFTPVKGLFLSVMYGFCCVKAGLATVRDVFFSEKVNLIWYITKFTRISQSFGGIVQS